MSLYVHENLEQGSEEWLAARRGMVTASIVGQLISTKPPTALDYDCPQCDASAGDPCVSMAKKERTPVKVAHSPRATKAAENPDNLPMRNEVADNDTSRAATALLVAERITGWSDPTWVSADMMRGHDIEPIARNLYAETVASVAEVGFMVRDDWGFQIGYSPDGLVGDDGLIEIKGPRMKGHLITHLSGEVPLQHMAQIQCGLLVADRQWCDFVSFYAGMPPFIKRVERDEKWGEVIVEAVKEFEVNALQMRAEYDTATTGLPATERLLIDMEMVI